MEDNLLVTRQQSSSVMQQITSSYVGKLSLPAEPLLATTFFWDIYCNFQLV